MEDQHRSARQAFRGEFPICWYCQINVTTDVDELANGPARREAYGERCCYMAACSWCNCHVATDKKQWPLERKLAVKWRMDRDCFDLERVNKIRRGHRQVTWPDVVIAICRLIDG